MYKVANSVNNNGPQMFSDFTSHGQEHVPQENTNTNNSNAFIKYKPQPRHHQNSRGLLSNHNQLPSLPSPRPDGSVGFPKRFSLNSWIWQLSKWTWDIMLMMHFMNIQIVYEVTDQWSECVPSCIIIQQEEGWSMKWFCNFCNVMFVLLAQTRLWLIC